ncbi:MAG: family 10 glycosylhydrolase [Candidatus Marinimicrobia bacterium]|nr:family 10 glycosylhydrolase [Candidatus Neomarinimicrobiota bacterium]MBT5339895.1 family 10 glycosylhydrolase [Candidatus Neomarinimicrobiota bacterium]MBT5999648.1 family 10 glycosylhydrolase [Candidatus Neomarinimicrobiota bacterium]MBT7111544.1 family 10 glycosylhydrolase [Candidatus Neomarinimicrobiota bacterium]
MTLTKFMKNWFILRRAANIVALLFLYNNLNAEVSLFQHRYLWIVRDAMTSEKKISAAVKYADQNGFNHILVQVRGRGDAYYKSGIVPKSIFIEESEFDPLADILLKAKLRGIKVHAWVNTYLIWSKNKIPTQRTHLLFKNSDWLDSNGKGSISFPNDIKQYKPENGDEGFYLAPHHPEVNKYLLSVFRELVAKYDLDGIHLDYVRFQNSSYGRNQTAMSVFLKKGGIDPGKSLSDLAPDYSERQALAEWSDYRRQAITKFVRDVSKMIKVIRPTCQLSAAVKPNLYQARNVFLQEWDVWLAAGYLDWAMPMNYTPDLRTFADNVNIIYDHLPARYREKIIMGIGTYNQSPLDAADKVTYTSITRFRGISLFSYNSLNKNPRYIQEIRDRIFPFLKEK